MVHSKWRQDAAAGDEARFKQKKNKYKKMIKNNFFNIINLIKKYKVSFIKEAAQRLATVERAKQVEQLELAQRMAARAQQLEQQGHEEVVALRIQNEAYNFYNYFC
jgi:hypothetical protein